MEQQLTIEERQRFWKAIDHFEDASRKIDRIHDVVIGDEVYGQEGMVKRMNRFEDELSNIKNQIIKAKGWAAGALAVGTAFGFILSNLIKILFK